MIKYDKNATNNMTLLVVQHSPFWLNFGRMSSIKSSPAKKKAVWLKWAGLKSVVLASLRLAELGQFKPKLDIYVDCGIAVYLNLQ